MEVKDLPKGQNGLFPSSELEPSLELGDVIPTQKDESIEVEHEVLTPKSEKLVLKKIDDQMEIFNLLNEYTPAVTKKIPLMSQGILLESETLNLSDLYAIGYSDDGRIKSLSMIYSKLTKSSKKIFGDSLETFFNAVSIFDLDIIYGCHVEAFGDEEFVMSCSKCKHEIEFKKPFKDLRVMDPMLKERISLIEQRVPVGMLEIADTIIPINENISFKLGIPSLKKYKILMENNNVNEAIFPYLLNIESIIFIKEQSELVFDEKYLDSFIRVMEKIKKPENYIETQAKMFEPLAVSFIAKVECPECGEINTRTKNDMLEEVIKKGLR